jgi:hypothetical protein
MAFSIISNKFSQLKYFPKENTVLQYIRYRYKIKILNIFYVQKYPIEWEDIGIGAELVILKLSTFLCAYYVIKSFILKQTWTFSKIFFYFSDFRISKTGEETRYTCTSCDRKRRQRTKNSRDPIKESHGR